MLRESKRTTLWCNTMVAWRCALPWYYRYYYYYYYHYYFYYFYNYYYHFFYYYYYYYCYYHYYSGNTLKRWMYPNGRLWW
jgi:hypothetical protein